MKAENLVFKFNPLEDPLHCQIKIFVTSMMVNVIKMHIKHIA
jgi:hypothetical protein